MRRVLLHVGTPKTGTSYLQDVLFHNPTALGRAGLRYPAERFDSHFLAALDLMRMPWGGLEADAVGAWDRVAKQVRDHDGTSIISHEILAGADRAQIGRALDSLGHGDGTDVHLVVSVRDLARQVPAEWQENVKHRATLSYAQFLDRIRDPQRESRIGSWFWSVQEVPAILDRWGADLPPEQVHLVTVPPPGGDPTELWRRFLQAFGLTGLELDLGTERSNPSLGVPETALVRRINAAANAELPPRHYRPLVRELVAHQTLSAHTDSPRLGLPPEHAAWVAELQESWLAAIRERGYDVIGDLADLHGTAPGESPEWVDPDAPDEAGVAAASIDALKAVLLEAATLTDDRDRLQAELHDTRAELERAYARPVQRGKERVVRTLEGSRPGRQVMRGYRHLLKRRSSS